MYSRVPTYGRRLVWRAVAISGALLLSALPNPSQSVSHPPGEGGVARARTIAGPVKPSGAIEPVATVIPPQNGGVVKPSWPPALMNPAANLRMAWDLALGRPNSHDVLFTFDDGPNPGTTDKLLGILDRARVKAVFFVCGWRLEDDEPMRSRARALLREELARGHVVGNHTMHHLNLATLTPKQIQYEVDHNADLIEEVTGQRPHLFRPPYGSYSEDVRNKVESRHDELTLWSIDSHDWQMAGDAQGVAMNVIRGIGNMAGGTVLLHDTHPWSVSATQMVLRWIQTENRDREAHGRPIYRVVNPTEFIEGARERIPLIEAARAEAARAQRAAKRHLEDADAAAPTPSQGTATIPEPHTH